MKIKKNSTYGYFHGHHSQQAAIAHILVNATRPCAPRNDVSWQKEGNEECCNEGGRGLCQLGEGDCDKNSDCEGSLVCGYNNCPWGDKDDCCMSPSKQM